MKLGKYLVILITLDIISFYLYNKFFSKYDYLEYLNSRTILKSLNTTVFVCIKNYNISVVENEKYYYLYKVTSNNITILCTSFYPIKETVNNTRLICLKVDNSRCLIEKLK